MDNTLKVLVGVVGFAGLIALLVPSQSKVETASNGAPLAVAPPPLMAPQIANDGETDAEFEDNDAELPDEDPEVDEFKFGEPSIDGQPFGGTYEPPSNGSNTNPNPSAENVPTGPFGAPTQDNGVLE